MADRPLLYLLIVLNVAVPVFIIFRRSVTRSGIRVNHETVFAVGYLFYWIFPVLVGLHGNLFSNLPLMYYWHSLFTEISDYSLRIYLVVTLSCYLAFCIGSYVGSRHRPAIPLHPQPKLAEGVLSAYLVAGVFAVLLIAGAIRHEFFTGYAGNFEQDWSQRGVFTAACVLLLILALLTSTHRHLHDQRGSSFASLFANRFFLAYAVSAVLLLSLGGRLYILSSIVMLVVYRSNYFRRVTLRAAMLVGGGVIVLAGILGVIRLGSQVTVKDAADGLYSESLYTSFSLVYYLGEPETSRIFPLWNWPEPLLTSFANLIPTALFPEKYDWMREHATLEHATVSPLGALNSYFSFMVNFGVLGSMVFLCLAGYALATLRTRDHLLLPRVIYVMICGWLMFSFFRDPFHVSIVKTVVQFSILVPALVFFSARMLSKSQILGDQIAMPCNRYSKRASRLKACQRPANRARIDTQPIDCWREI